MEILVIIALVVLVGAVLLFRRYRGGGRQLNVTTGNPPDNDGQNYRLP